MARKFLYVIAILIVLVLVGALAYRMFPDFLMRQAFVPTAQFVEQKPVSKNAYADPEMWFVHPANSDNVASWTPRDFAGDAAPPTDNGEAAAIFFVHPTSFLDRSRWNAPLDDATANTRARQFIRGEASVFNSAGQIWAPRYRQATLGAFLTNDGNAQRAFDAAYRDVAAAFDQFLEENPTGPMILAGHSQGSLHLTTLLREKVARTPIAERVVAAYVIGWPVSVAHDIAAMGLPACAGPQATGCIISWQSYAEPADPSMVLSVYDRTTGFDGQLRKGSRMLCSNPLSGKPDSGADASQNLGTVIPNEDFNDGHLVVGAVPARCDDDRGFLLIGDPPEVGQYVLPGNDYHVFDYPLFWASTRADVMRRLAAYGAR